jgi:carbamoyl-phosphate synthase large subunit
VAGRIGYLLIVRPSYVLGGRAMTRLPVDDLAGSVMTVAAASPEHPVFLDRFLRARSRSTSTLHPTAAKSTSARS